MGWRLPSDGLRKRFGSSFVNRLHRALGKLPDPTRNYLPPPSFSSSYELPYELENLQQLLPIADEMLQQLCDFLRHRDLSTSQLLFSLLHEKRSRTEIHIGLRQSSRSQEHLMLLLETHFNKLLIPAPVTTIKVEVNNFDAFTGYSTTLLSQQEDSAYTLHDDNNLKQFIEQLQARLGEQQIQSVHNMAQHCPEHASQLFDFNEAGKNKNRSTTEKTASNIRPFWLLQNPVQLNIRKGKLYHRRAITIISGPERIESHWWAENDVRRDYYIAKEASGSRLWIYREKDTEKNWFLHGLFA